MSTPLRRGLSRFVGWAADRQIPRPLRSPLFRTYAKLCGCELDEVRLALDMHPSLGAFFVRHLVAGARPLPTDEGLVPSPVDGRIQRIGRVNSGELLQAKGRSYSLDELTGGLSAEQDFEDAQAWTIYLSPRDYHRIHTPLECELRELRVIQGARYSVAPRVLDRRAVLNVNERCALRLETARGTILLVLVGALNVGRIRVVGVAPEADGPLSRPLPFARGAELARFELGSTIVMITPRGMAEPTGGLEHGAPVRLGQAIGRWLV